MLDEQTLAQWLEDELTGEAKTQAETWAAGQPEWLAQREQVRAMKRDVSRAFSREMEPPAAEFFNARILHEIQKEPSVELKVARRGVASWVQLGAAAACVLGAFWLGRVNASKEDAGAVVNAVPVVNEAEMPLVYAPMSRVKANFVSSKKSNATVIVLDGVKAMSGELEQKSTVQVESEAPSQVAAKTESSLPKSL